MKIEIGDRVEYDFTSAQGKKRYGTVVRWYENVDGKDPSVEFDGIPGDWPCRIDNLRVLSVVERLAELAHEDR